MAAHLFFVKCYNIVRRVTFTAVIRYKIVLETLSGDDVMNVLILRLLWSTYILRVYLRFAIPSHEGGNLKRTVVWQLSKLTKLSYYEQNVDKLMSVTRIDQNVLFPDQISCLRAGSMYIRTYTRYSNIIHDPNKNKNSIDSAYSWWVYRVHNLLFHIYNG